MATLTIGGKTVVTQTGTDEPIMTSNVVMDNVNINNALTTASFPTGTFTPVFQKLNTNIDAFVNNSPVAEGFYQKMGKVVYVTGSIKNDTSFEYNSGVGSSDGLAIGGLPFDASLQSSEDWFWNQGAFHIWFNSITAWSASYNQVGLIRSNNDSNPRNQIGLYYYVANGTQLVATQYYLSASSQIIFNGWYFTDD